MENSKKIDVWDFGAERLDAEKYNNILNEDIMNEYFGAGHKVGSTGVTIGDVFLNFSKSGSVDGYDMMFSSGGKNKHRIRSTNERLTRFDNGVRIGIDEDGVVYGGHIYSNSAPNPDVYLALALEQNDIVTVMLGTNGNETEYCFESLGGKNRQSYIFKTDGPKAQKAVFYAASRGVYKLYCPKEKLVVYRIYREHIDQVKLKGKILDKIPKDAKLNIVNTVTGQIKSLELKNRSYDTYVSSKYTYKFELINDAGYMVTEDTELVTVPTNAERVEHNINLETYELVSVSGIIEGIPKIKYLDMLIEFKTLNHDVRYIPTMKITDDTYNIKFEKGVEYKVNAYGVNDYILKNDKVCFEEDIDYFCFQFEKKPLYDVKLVYEGEEARGYRIARFINRNERGYEYVFRNDEPIALRDGQYKVIARADTAMGVAQEILYTKDCIVAGGNLEYTLPIKQMYGDWKFELFAEYGELDGYLAGLITRGNVSLHKDKYLNQKKGSTVSFEVKAGQRITIKYCYMASFMIEGAGIEPQPIFEFSGTSKLEEEKTFFAKEDGEVILTGIIGVAKNGSGVDQTFYIAIKVEDMIKYQEKLCVGKDKECTTIKEALNRVSRMIRPNDERVTISIDPGNYEEMLVIKDANITFENASKNPDIKLCNKGIDIGENAVRITSYYGHGYAYYSMGTDCKYDERLLEVNKHNGILSFENPGTGMSKGSYWNTTVAVFAGGFEAKDIIFENSFNQYVSEKAANDVLIKLPSGKGDRSGLEKYSTAIQDRSFVERAAAIALANRRGKFKFTNCRFVGRQDTLYGGEGNVVLFNKCKIMGACDYIYGGMTACFKECELILNTSDNEMDVAYITAAQQPQEIQGYLMYRCRIVSAKPLEETASTKMSKPGYLGRPWSIGSEVVYFETYIDETDYFGKKESIITKAGWNDTLGGKAPRCYECASFEASGENNERARADWAKVLRPGDAFIVDRMSTFEEQYGEKVFVKNA
ncbi:MAG: hypothetical protein E7252_06460 [Lachnospira sp.]|nr:hypothetical protein [Lachnospira sp.]